jgi:hypothetical protein
LSTRSTLPMLGLAAAASFGCMSVAYHARQAPLGDPTTPAAHVEGVTTWDKYTPPGSFDTEEKGVIPVVTADGYKIDDQTSDTRTGVVWDLRVDGGAGVGVVTMMWSRPASPRCQGGHPALDLLLDRDAPPPNSLAPDRQVHWERPVVVRGQRVVSARFDEDPVLLREPAVVDVMLLERDDAGTREVCVRVPVSGPRITYWSDHRWSPGVRFALRRAQAFTPATTFTLGLSLGRWIGPVRLAVEGDIGGTNDDNPQASSPSGTWVCVASPGPQCDAVKLGGFALEASGSLARWGPHWGLGWSAAYEAIFGGLEHIDPTTGGFVTRHAGAGGARLGLRLFAAVPDLEGVSPYSPTSAWALELFAAATEEWYGVAGGHPLTLGIAGVGF